MVHRGLDSFSGKKIVMLQGPVGPFFKNLASDLENIGAIVHKINFNGGDLFFSAFKKRKNFTGKPEEWPSFFTDFIEKNGVDTVILFGDCREYHSAAHAIAVQKNLDIGVFEEGYVRPDFITFEEFGVNGNSQLPSDPNFYKQLSEDDFNVGETVHVGNSFWWTAWYAFLYYLFSAVGYFYFYHYKHHRSLNPWEITYWIRSMWRKQWYKVAEAGIQSDLVLHYQKKYYLMPLQITTDAQVRDHSQFSSVENFIDRAVSSFSAYAPKNTLLVIKHHPLDRGYHDYGAYIKRLSEHYNLQGRILYIHDQHLPTLLEYARGVVMINSTVGLSAIHHNAPLKACSTAIYNFEGLSYQGNLDDFWKDAPDFSIDYDLYLRFKGYVIKHKQINGNFYKKVKNSKLKSGILWSDL